MGFYTLKELITVSKRIAVDTFVKNRSFNQTEDIFVANEVKVKTEKIEEDTIDDLDDFSMRIREPIKGITKQDGKGKNGTPKKGNRPETI